MGAMRWFIQWLWGPSSLGRIVKFNHWWPSFDRGGCNDWRQWGIAWPCVVVDYKHHRETTTPIWNWVWLRSRLGYPYKCGGDGGAM